MGILHYVDEIIGFDKNQYRKGIHWCHICHISEKDTIFGIHKNNLYLPQDSPTRILRCKVYELDQNILKNSQICNDTVVNSLIHTRIPRGPHTGGTHSSDLDLFRVRFKFYFSFGQVKTTKE